MTQPILGIDISKDKFDVALILDAKTYQAVFDNSPTGFKQLSKWLERNKTGEIHACMEATGKYGEDLAEYLFEQKHQVSVVNPARIKFYGNSKLRRNKTDKADASLIAEYCSRENPRLWSPPPASFSVLRSLVRHLDDLMDLRQQEVNRLKSGPSTDLVIASHKTVIACLDEQIKKTKAAIQSHIEHCPELLARQKLLVSIPGIGKLTAARLLGEIRDILDFEDARQLAAFAGLTPRCFSSGSSVHKKARLTKTGNSNIRKALYMPSICAKHHNPIVAAFCLRMAQNGLKPMEIIGAAMHKLLRIVYGVLKSGLPFNPNLLANAC